MKYNELHRKIKAAGWKKLRSEGSHFIFIKDGKMSLQYLTTVRRKCLRG